MDLFEEPENIEEVLQNEDSQRFEIGNDLERFETEHDIEDNNQDDNQNDEDGKEEEKKADKPKRITRPRAKLNAETLKGPKGLGALGKILDKVQFKGKGYEDRDINVLLKCYEYWCHRMFPKFPFEDAVLKIETLGQKGPIQTYLKKMRSGMIDPSDDETNLAERPLDSEDEDHLPATSSTVKADVQPVQLTEEQLERIRLNKEKAERLRKERLMKIQNKASEDLPECSEPIVFVNKTNESFDKNEMDPSEKEQSIFQRNLVIEQNVSNEQFSQNEGTQQDSQFSAILGNLNVEQNEPYSQTEDEERKEQSNSHCSAIPNVTSKPSEQFSQSDSQFSAILGNFNEPFSQTEENEPTQQSDSQCSAILNNLALKPNEQFSQNEDTEQS